MRINHIAVWTYDIERLREFYVTYFGAVAGTRYHNSKKGLTTYFLTFPSGGARLELMHIPGLDRSGRSCQAAGLCHIAISLGSREAVDALTEKMRKEGVRILGEPRTTGDGYYESVVSDPEGNLIELTV